MTQLRPTSGRQPLDTREPVPRPSMLPLRRCLLTGTGYMIPFVVTGGVLLALAAVLGGPEPSAGTGTVGLDLLLGGDPVGWWDTVGTVGVLRALGTVTFALLVPVLAGFVAYAMAGPPALVAGMVGGLLSSIVGAGYLGGLVAGLLAGSSVLLLRRLRLPSTVDGFATVVGIPVISTLIVGLALLVVIGPPITAFHDQVAGLLTQLSSGDRLLLGAVLGLMICVDLGGPVSKIAYTFAVTTLTQGDGTLMAAVIAAGMTAPLGLAAAATLRPRLFGPSERNAGKAAWLLGASFVTEGAIPFAVADPLRVLPSAMLGGAVAGALSMAGPVSTSAPHGGLWFVLATSAPLTWLTSVAVGSAFTGAAVIALRVCARPEGLARVLSRS